MAGRHQADLHLEFEDALAAAAVEAAAGIELADMPTGCRASAVRAGARLDLHIEAPNLSALRASIQVLRLMDAAARVAGEPAGDKV